MDVVDYWRTPFAEGPSPPTSEAVVGRSPAGLDVADDGRAPLAVAVRAVDSVGKVALRQLVRRHPPPQPDGQERTTMFEIRLGGQVSVRLSQSDREVDLITDGLGDTQAAGAAELLVVLSFLHRSLVSIEVCEVAYPFESAARGIYLVEPMESWTDLRRAASSLSERVDAVVQAHPGRIRGLAVATADAPWEPHLLSLHEATETLRRCMPDFESHVETAVPMVVPRGEPAQLSVLLLLSTRPRGITRAWSPQPESV